MDLTLNEDQLALQSGIRDYLADKWNPDRLRAAITPPASPAASLVAGAADPGGSGMTGSGWTQADWKELGELGVFGILAPPDAGGMGLLLADAAIVLEELGAALVPGPLVATIMAASLIDGAATGDRVVTALDTADPTWLVEHPADATDVVLVADDGLFRLPVAELPLLPVTTPLDPLTPVALVERSGTPAGQRVVGGLCIGGPAEAAAWRTRGAVLTAALAVGVARGGLDLAVRYAGEREQFGRVIGGFQAVKHLLAESLARIELARAAVLSAAVVADDPVVGGTATGDPATAAATAKLLADEAATAGGRTSLQVHGGMGFTWEVLVHLYLKRAWVLETSFGTADAHAAFLASRL